MGKPIKHKRHKRRTRKIWYQQNERKLENGNFFVSLFFGLKNFFSFFGYKNHKIFSDVILKTIRTSGEQLRDVFVHCILGKQKTQCRKICVTLIIRIYYVSLCWPTPIQSLIKCHMFVWNPFHYKCNFL